MRFLILFLFAASALGGTVITPSASSGTPTSISNGGATIEATSGGAINATTAAGQPMNIAANGGSYFTLMPIYLGSLSLGSGNLSASGQYALGFDGSILKYSVNGAGWAVLPYQATLTNSAGLASALSDETGTGSAVFGTSPTIATPSISGGTITGGTLAGNTTATGKIIGKVGASNSLSYEITGYGGVGFYGESSSLSVALNGQRKFCFDQSGTYYQFFLDGASHLAWGTGLGDTVDVSLYRVAAAVQGLSGSGTNGAVLEIKQVSSLGTPSANSGRIGVISGEVNVEDASGNVTVISPHAKDAPPDLYELGPGLDEMHRKLNIFTGSINWSAMERRQIIDRLDMAARTGTKEESVAAWTEFGQRQATSRIRVYVAETFEDYEKRTGVNLYPDATWKTLTPAQRWGAVEQQRVAETEAKITEWQTRKDAAATAMADFNALPVEQQIARGVPPQFSEAKPETYTPQHAPAWIKAH